jgi:Putative Flp pilus-assembly TadE/G-like
MFALFAVVAFAMLLVAAFVIDVGNWWEHRRHLQVQVDDGAIAAGQEFTGCYQDPDQSNANIQRVARQFAGDPAFSTSFPGYGAPYNLQVDDPDRVVLNLNRATYPPSGPDFDPSYDLNSTIPDIQYLPCDALTLEVKAKDRDVPTFFGGVVPAPAQLVDIRARARIEIHQVETLSGFLPWAIPEVDPKHVAVIFMNEGTGTEIMAFELVKEAGTTILNGTPVQLWNGSQAALDMERQTGMIVVTSRLGSDPADPAFSVGGTPDAICSQPKTACYSDSSVPIDPTSGLIFVRANQDANGGAWNAPVLGEVTLLPGDCTEDSAPFYLVEADCHVGVHATVDFGAACGADPSANPCRASVTAIGAGCGGSTNLAFSGGTWSATCGNPKIAANSGKNPIRIEWSSHNPGPGTPNSASATFPDSPASRVYAKDDNAGPIEYVRVVPNPAAGGGPQAVSVSVGVPPSLQVANKLDPAILLRFKQRNGPNTQQVDCDEAPTGPEDEIGKGCQTFYQVDDDGICPPEYDEGPELPPNVPPNPPVPVPSCAAVRPGSVDSMDKGLAYRWENPAQPYGSCPPNNWPKTATDPIPGSGDPRWVILLVTDIAAFKANPGQDPVVPILKWAGFYVTGWDISAKTNGCPDNDPHPLGYPSNKDNGDVWGHFVNYVPFIPGSTPDKKFCNFTEIGICIAVLTE